MFVCRCDCVAESIWWEFYDGHNGHGRRCPTQALMPCEKILHLRLVYGMFPPQGTGRFSPQRCGRGRVSNCQKVGVTRTEASSVSVEQSVL